jgi:hypothetical protein
LTTDFNEGSRHVRVLNYLIKSRRKELDSNVDFSVNYKNLLIDAFALHAGPCQNGLSIILTQMEDELLSPFIRIKNLWVITKNLNGMYI